MLNCYAVYDLFIVYFTDIYCAFGLKADVLCVYVVVYIAMLLRLQLVLKCKNLSFYFYQLIYLLVWITWLYIPRVRKRFDIIFHELPIGSAGWSYGEFDARLLHCI